MSDPVMAEATGTIDGANVDFTTPSAYQPGTLWTYINGVLVDRDGPEGVVELSGNAFQTKEAPQTGDTLHVWYDETPPSFGGYPTPPRFLSALVLEPRAAALDLVPSGHSEDVTTVTESPSAHTTELKPEDGRAIDLVPTPLSAEEV